MQNRASSKDNIKNQWMEVHFLWKWTGKKRKKFIETLPDSVKWLMLIWLWKHFPVP